jgi:hypothetical protein
VVRKRVFWVIKTRNACGQLPCHEINLRNGRHACKKSNSLLYHTHRRHHESDQIMSNLWLIYSQTQGHVSKNCELVFGMEAIITKKPTKRCCRVNGCWFSAIQTHGARASKWEKCYIDASGWAAARKNNDSLSIIIGTHKERGGKLSRDHFSAHELRCAHHETKRSRSRSPWRVRLYYLIASAWHQFCPHTFPHKFPFLVKIPTAKCLFPWKRREEFDRNR